MPRCYNHPERASYKTCNYCHSPVCQSCIWSYEKTMCIDCYVDMLIRESYEPFRKKKRLFIVYGTFVFSLTALFWFGNMSGLAVSLLMAITLATGGFLWYPLKKVSRIISEVIDSMTKGLIGLILILFFYYVAPVLACVAVSILWMQLLEGLGILGIVLLFIPLPFIFLFGRATKRDYDTYLSEKRAYNSFRENYDGIYAKEYHAGCWERNEEYQDTYDDMSNAHKEDAEKQEQQREYEEYQEQPQHKEPHKEAQDFFAGCTTRESVKERYRALVVIYHPDKRNGDTEISKIINNQYEDRMNGREEV